MTRWLSILALVALAGEPGRLQVNVAPAAARVFVDGAARATGNLAPTSLPAGTHTVDVELDGHTPAHQVVEVAEGKTACLSITLVRASRTPRGDPSDATARDARGALAAEVVASAAAGAAGRPALEREAPTTHLPTPPDGDPRNVRPTPPPGPSAAPPPWEIAAPCPD